MLLTSSSFKARRASISKSFLGGKHMIKIGRHKYKLPDDIAKSQMTSEQSEMTGWRMFLIILLAITLIGLILAIPLYFAGKKKRVVMAFKAKDGETFTVAATNNNEAAMLQPYSGIGTFD